MEIFKPVFLLLSVISFGASSFGQVWKQYADSAKIFQEQKKLDKAIEFYSKANEELKKDSAGTSSYAISCNDLALLYRNMGEYEKAAPLYMETKEIREKLFGKKHPEYAASCNNLAILYMFMGEYEKAEPLYLEAKQIREKVLGKQHFDYAASCNNLAALYYNMGEYEKAEPLYLETMQIREKLLGKEHPEYAKSCNNLALLYRNLGQYKKAEPLYLESKQIWEKVYGKEHPDYASACNNLAILYYDMALYDAAELLYLEAKQIREKVLGREHPDYAGSCNGLAIFYWNMGRYEKAEPLYLEARQIREKMLGKEHPDYANSCDNLAVLYQSMGQFEKAEALYLEAKQIKEKVLGKEHPEYANSCNNLAILYKDIGQYAKAELLVLEAKQIREKVLGKDHPLYAESCNNLANLYGVMGQYEKAEVLLLEAKQILGKAFGIEHPDYAGACDNLAVLYCDMGQYKKAETFATEAKQIRQKALGKQHHDYGSSCESLARLYRAMHQPSKAEKEFEEAFSVNAYNLLSFFQFTNEKEKAAFIKNISGEDDNAYSFYVSEKIRSGQPYSLSLFHRNLILSSSQALKKQVFSANDTAITNKYNEWVNLKKYLSVLYSRPVDERGEDAAKIEEQAGQLEKELTRLSAGFKKQRQRVDWKDIKNKLHADEASIEFASFHFNPAAGGSKRSTDTVFYVANVLRKDSRLPSMVYLFDEKQLTDLIFSAVITTTGDGVKELYASAAAGKHTETNKSIYELIWKPLEKELKGIKTIYFAPSGLLHRIAFAALPVNKKEVLSDRYKLVQLTTTASVAGQQPSYISTTDKIQLYGGISYRADTTALKDAMVAYRRNEKAGSNSLPGDLTRGDGWNDLPGTRNEVKNIESLAGQYRKNIITLSGINATEESLKALDGRASPAVLHIATHGFFFPDPKQRKNSNKMNDTESGKVFKLSDDPLVRSGLLFAGANHAWQNKPVEGIDDGILTAYEVSNLYLPNTKLVVLSACETGLGDIQGSEGVYGLQRAFKIAGAENLVMSLWKVPDLETTEFMQHFYRNLFAKQNISDAFHNAQKVMKDKYRLQPYKWAAWVLVR